MSDPPPSLRSLFEDHERVFAENEYVYPVVSRRAGGLSIGINLNIDKVCNFDCAYCQVDRRTPARRRTVDLARLDAELEQMTDLAVSGKLFETRRFQATPTELRRLNDFALSGDGEPTTCPSFPEVVELCAAVRGRRRLDGVKIVLITNATVFHRDRVRQGLELLDRNNGEIWAKLDAGTEAYYRLVDRTVIPFDRVLRNLLDAARVRPIVIQSLFMRVHGQPPPAEELEAYAGRLAAMVAGGGRIKLVQVHTIARAPAERWVEALSDAEVDALADFVRQRTGLPVAAYYGC